MKLHRIELIVVDFESYGIDDICESIKQTTENSLVRVVSSSSVDVGSDYWADDNVINLNKSSPDDIIAEFERVSLENRI